MDDNKSFQDMLRDLRSQFNRKIPGGLTSAGEDRLNRTLKHYVKEVNGKGQPRDILRLSYDSMAKWVKKTLVANETFANTAPADRFETEMDLADAIASIKAAPNAAEDLEIVPRTMPRPAANVQQKDVIQPHEDTVKYREVEYNLLMNSKDRNWAVNTTQNRYNFSIQFNSNLRQQQGSGYQATINTRLRNIARLEFIKAILPVEGLEVITQPDCSSNHAYAFSSVLALPSVNVMVDEFQGNNYGTNNFADKSLAICQYDAAWRSDPTWSRAVTSRGFTLFFPKFMKAQRIYTPAPLANLQTLSFQLQDPEGNILSQSPDSSAIKQIVFGQDISGALATSVFGSCFPDNSNNYIFVNTTTWFPLWSYSQFDKIQFQGLADISGTTGLTDWLQNSGGHTVVGTAYNINASTYPYDISGGVNENGYANWVIIQNRLTDASINGNPTAYPWPNTMRISQVGAILNLSRQVQLYIRVITREYDLVSNVRADNV